MNNSLRYLSNKIPSLKRPSPSSSSLLKRSTTSSLSTATLHQNVLAPTFLSSTATTSTTSEAWEQTFLYSSSSSSSWRMAAFLSTAALVAATATATTSCFELQDPQFHHYFDESEDVEDDDDDDETESSSQENATLLQIPSNGVFPHLPPPKRRSTITKGLRDPMTSYAVYAVRREIMEEEEVDGVRHDDPSLPSTHRFRRSSNSPTTVQATSSSSNNNHNNNESETPLPSPLTAPERITDEEARIEEATRKAKQHSGGLKIFSGNGNMPLALEICKYLGINLGKASVGRFADGECSVVINENVRGKDVYVIQPTCQPVNDNMMELLLMVSTLRRASARRITVVIPYYGYARQDRKMQARVPISAADVARLMEAMGVDRVIAVDLHCGQIQGFFGPRVPVDNLDGGIVGLDYFGCKDLHNPVIVSPDAGGVYRAKKFKEGLEHKYDMQDIGLAMIIKQRARAGSVDQMDLVGDVRDCDCIIVDDMIDTAGTLCKAAEVLKEKGARRVFAFASHGLLSGPGNDRIAASELSEVVILNTIPTSPQRQANDKLTELSVAPLLAQAIFNIHAKKSISALFK